MAKKIKVKKIAPKVKEIKKLPLKSELHDLESEVEFSDTENFAKFVRRKKADSTLEQEEITPIGRVTRIVSSKDDERETNFRPSYTGGNSYQTNQAYLGAESTGNSSEIGNNRNQEISRQDPMAVRTDFQEPARQSGGGEREGKREYAGKEKETEKRNR